jgi:hypothetical protein
MAPSGRALSVSALASQSRRFTLQGRGTNRSRFARVGAGLTEQTRILKVSVLRRKPQGRGAIRLCLVRVGAGLTEQTHSLQVSAQRRIP